MSHVNALSLRAVIRIRPGRSWRLNPSYLGELRSLSAPRVRGFTGAEILDVLGVEVDGVDIAAGVGEAQVLLATDELAQALLRLTEGAPAAQATIGPGPTELLLEARGPDLLLTLISLAPPLRIVAGGLLVDAAKMRTATLQAARGLLLDLLAISPTLGETPLAVRLAAATSQLATAARKPAPAWPGKDQPALTTKVGARPSLEIALSSDAHARLLGRGKVPHAPLAPWLGVGTLALRRPGAPGLSCEGPLFLLLRNLLGEAESLAAAWEAGDPAFSFRFGEHELRCDLTRDELRAPGWKKPLELPVLRLAALLAEGALAYTRLAGRAPGEPGSSLSEAAHKLLRHCNDLTSGDLRRRPAAIRGPPRLPPPEPQPLAQGAIRRLVYRTVFEVPAGGALGMLAPGGGALLLELPGALEARSLASGETLWKTPSAPGALARGGDVVHDGPGDALALLELQSGEPRWKRRLRPALHPARLWSLPSGVARSLPGEGLALVDDTGHVTFRIGLPGGAPQDVLEQDGVLLVTLASGLLAGLDRTGGELLWKRKGQVGRALVAQGTLLALSKGALTCLEPQTGAVLWAAETPEGALAVFEDSALVLGEGRLLSIALDGGKVRGERALPWATTLAHDELVLIATGPKGQAARLDARANLLWELGQEGEAPARPAGVQRGVVLLHRAQTSLRESGKGLRLAELRLADSALLFPDLSCALLGGGVLSLHRLATHLSLV